MIFQPAPRTPQVRANALAQRKAGQERKYRRQRARQPPDFFEGENSPIQTVSADRFIRTFTGEHDRDVVAREFGNEIQRNAARVRHRFIEVRHHGRDRIPEIAAGDAEFMMLRAEMSRCFARIREFIGFLSFNAGWSAGVEANAERLHSFAAGDLAHHGEYRAGIQAAAEKHSKRNIGDQPQADALLEQMSEFLQALLGLSVTCLVRHIPIFADLDALLVHRHPVARLQLENVFEHRARPRNVAQREIQIQRLGIHFSRHSGMLEQ